MRILVRVIYLCYHELSPGKPAAMYLPTEDWDELSSSTCVCKTS